jgi:hypothetical protein
MRGRFYAFACPFHAVKISSRMNSKLRDTAELERGLQLYRRGVSRILILPLEPAFELKNIKQDGFGFFVFKSSIEFLALNLGGSFFQVFLFTNFFKQ